MTNFTFSKNNVGEFASNGIKSIFQQKKFSKAKSFIINLPIEYKEIVTKFNENMENHGFTGTVKVLVNSITSRCSTNDGKHKFIINVSHKFKVPDVIAVR